MSIDNSAEQTPQTTVPDTIGLTKCHKTDLKDCPQSSVISIRNAFTSHGTEVQSTNSLFITEAIVDRQNEHNLLSFRTITINCSHSKHFCKQTTDYRKRKLILQKH